MKIDTIRVFGFEAAIRDMRNPLESWGRSDSAFYITDPGGPTVAPESPLIGPADLALACKLIKAGRSHRKFLREILVWCRLTLPRYLWAEMDTYKVGTVRNSCSTMHRLGSRDLSADDFEGGDVDLWTLHRLNAMGRCYRTGAGYESDGRLYVGADLLRHMKAALPEGYLQTAGFLFSYETALAMYADRRRHRLPEWSGPGGLCEFIVGLPYMLDFLKAAGALPA